jgi:hypothetical protein
LKSALEFIIQTGVFYGVQAAIDSTEPWLVWLAPRIASCIASMAMSFIFDSNWGDRLWDTLEGCAYSFLPAPKEVPEIVSGMRWRAVYAFEKAQRYLFGWEDCWGWC